MHNIQGPDPACYIVCRVPCTVPRQYLIGAPAGRRYIIFRRLAPARRLNIEYYTPIILYYIPASGACQTPQPPPASAHKDAAATGRPPSPFNCPRRPRSRGPRAVGEWSGGSDPCFSPGRAAIAARGPLFSERTPAAATDGRPGQSAPSRFLTPSLTPPLPYMNSPLTGQHTHPGLLANSKSRLFCVGYSASS